MGGFGFLSLRGIFLELTRRAASMSVRDAFMTSIAFLRTAFFFFFVAHDGRDGCRSIFLPFLSILSLVHWYHKRGVIILQTQIWVCINTSATNHATYLFLKPITWWRDCRFRPLVLVNSRPWRRHHSKQGLVSTLFVSGIVSYPRGEQLS